MTRAAAPGEHGSEMKKLFLSKAANELLLTVGLIGENSAPMASALWCSRCWARDWTSHLTHRTLAIWGMQISAEYPIYRPNL